MYRTSIGCLAIGLFICSTVTVGYAQNNSEKYVIAPPDCVLLVVASQPDCPLQLEHSRLLLGVTPRTQPEFEFKGRNIGKKSILRYTLSFWASNSTGGTLGNGQSVNKPLLPGEVVSEFNKDSQIVPLSNETRTQLKLGSEMQMIVVLMVENVVFEDGTSYNAATTSKALAEFFQRG